MIRERNLDSLPTYGRLSFAKIRHLRTAIHFLIADGYLKRDGGESPLLHLTEKRKSFWKEKRRYWVLLSVRKTSWRLWRWKRKPSFQKPKRYL